MSMGFDANRHPTTDAAVEGCGEMMKSACCQGEHMGNILHSDQNEDKKEEGLKNLRNFVDVIHVK